MNIDILICNALEDAKASASKSELVTVPNPGHGFCLGLRGSLDIKLPCKCATKTE